MRKPGPGLLPQADELPDALPDLPVARAVLSRTSVAALRVRHGVPLREVRRGARPDPGARADHGRRAHLLHPRADARRADVAAALRARSARRLRPDGLLPRAVHQGSRTSSSAPTRCGRKPPACCAEVGAASGLELVPDPGGAAFYGPKISVQVKDALGRSWQMSTIQLDFNFPERFELEYTAADGSRQRPVMIHRALFGSIERFFGILTEHYAGAFPAWLAPVQVVGIPVADGHVAVPGRRCRATEDRTGSGPRWTPATTGWPRRSSTTPTRRCRSCCWPATATSRPAR